MSQKPSSADISETESGIIDPMVSKRPENNKSNKSKKQENLPKVVELGGVIKKLVNPVIPVNV